MKEAYVLGISCYYHDSAAALIKDGEILGACQEERFTRKKHDPAFPSRAVKYLLEHHRLTLDDIGAVVYYEKPFVTFERILETQLNYAPRGFKSFIRSLPLWIKEKLFLDRDVEKKLLALGLGKPPALFFSEHHLSHAAAAYYPSPFEEAAILCVDGVGEWATTSAWVAHGKDLAPLWEIHFPHSLGLLYSTLTTYLGFKVNSGEYKIMGLAPYGEPRFLGLLEKHLLTLHPDGSYSLNMDYFDYGHSLRMSGKKLESLLGRSSRVPEGQLDQFHMDVAASIQKLLEKALLHVTSHLQRRTGKRALCLSGGVALNCVANSRILQESGFEEIWIQPAAGDAGSALGAAQAYWHLHLKKDRVTPAHDAQKGSLLGPAFKDQEIEAFLESEHVPFQRAPGDELYRKASEYLSQGKIIGWFQGAMEYGPRALGSRSIIADARVADLQKTMNLKIKFRESFRPFAPLVLEEDTSTVFDWEVPSPYMLFVAPVKEELRIPMKENEKALFGIEKLNVPRSRYPAITHVDYSARLQTVGEDRHPELHRLLTAFKKRTGHSVLVNTSFNVRGEPIVLSPADAYRCFRRTDIDVLIMGHAIVEKNNLPEFSDTDWRREFELD